MAWRRSWPSEPITVTIPQSLQDAKDSYDFLEARYQNTKTTALAILAVITYGCDIMKFWKCLGAFTAYYIENNPLTSLALSVL
jgi:hypothetical protein